ncbi:sodium/sulfate symporter [Alkalidesulfovibrio alkalitolerans DSM 16529]|uniref:Sodium/sulfate symporter n=1 Tax=Alkalidesulfovibrio alkalitolerans DSM 16529 TaxID=1121439 RepID=S7UH00_9BACT|nr:SLC13 family permease [Alkalidesulfovibrio alkalitolerans]EPR33109.1 sodium/sulfate symporter [Alkalidesulfovibrio alkalitolerans DSM 16529]
MSAHAAPGNSPDELVVHEEESQGPVQSGRTILLKVLFAFAVGIGIYLLPTPETLPAQGHKFLALVTTVIILWVSEAIPIGVTALCAAAGLILFGIESPNRAWAPFASPAVMFVLMIIMFGVVLNEVGLANRIMSWIFKIAGTGVKRLSFVLAVGCTMLATIFHDATVTVIMIFALVPVLRAMGITPGKSNNLSKFFIILIPLAASAGGFGTLLGGGRNPLAVEILAKYTNGAVNVGFMEYLIIQFPLSIFTALATWAVVYMIFRPKEKELPAAVRIEKMPPMRGKELGVTIIFTLTFILWTFSDLTGWHVSVVAALALAGFCGPKFISFKTICDKFPWESWIVFGAGVSLGASMLNSGAGKYLAEVCLPLLQGQPSFLVFYGMGFFGSFLSSMMSNSAAVALTLPITLPMAEMLNMSPQAVALLAPITTSFIMLVIGCPPTIIAYSTGYFSQVDFIKVAVPWCLVLLGVAVVGVMFYWPMIGFY